MPTTRRELLGAARLPEYSTITFELKLPDAECCRSSSAMLMLSSSYVDGARDERSSITDATRTM